METVRSVNTRNIQFILKNLNCDFLFMCMASIHTHALMTTCLAKRYGDPAGTCLPKVVTFSH